MRSILLLEDDEGLNRGITLSLRKEGYAVFPAYNVKEAEKIFWAEGPDMVISDVALPDGNGMEFGKRIREQSRVCLVYLTALDEEFDIINGYASGADDYVTKPFSLMVLMSKVNAIMRRLDGSGADILKAEDIEIHIKEGLVTKKGEEVSLSRTELQLLIYFLENAGQILSNEQFLEKIWGNEGQFVDDNTVTVNISRLKSKLQTTRLSNVRGVGYLWDGQVIRK